MFTIRSSRDKDIPTLTEIYSYYVSHTTYTLEITPPTFDEMANRRADVQSKNMLYLIAEQADLLVGYAYCNWFKPRAAYRFSTEVSIFLNKDTCGKGLGRQLLNALIHEAELVDIRKIITVIGDSKNERSIGLHLPAGFSHVGTFKFCGWKFNRWLDMTLMEKNIGESDTIPPE
jgi:phosphinothricin acetyltransferase